MFLYGTALVFKSFVSEIREEEGWGQIEFLGERKERKGERKEEKKEVRHEEGREKYEWHGDEKGDAGHAETLSVAGDLSRSELTELDHESVGNELD